jgi:hypothetical protein
VNIPDNGSHAVLFVEVIDPFIEKRTSKETYAIFFSLRE